MKVSSDKGADVGREHVARDHGHSRPMIGLRFRGCSQAFGQFWICFDGYDAAAFPG